MSLTQKNFRSIRLPEGLGDKIFFDDSLPGFGLRVREGGKRTWIVQYRAGAVQRRVTLGTVETLDAGAARKAAKDVLAKVHLGQDPQAAKIEARKPKPKELTVGDAIDDYLGIAEQKLRPSTYYGVDLHLRKHWKALHIHELRKVERRHVAVQLEEIKANSGLVGANRSRAALSSFFTWAMGAGLADANPVIGTNKPLGREVARDRVLNAAELRAVWLEAGRGDYSAIVKLLMLTGQRREEVAAMTWAEIDFRNALWTLPKERTKNARAHEVPLSAPAVAILRGLNKREGRELVFGEGRGPFSGWSNCKTRLDARVLARLRQGGPDASLPPWRVHDLRRTAATGMADLGVPPHVVEVCLNHAGGFRAGVGGTYNRAFYSAEKRDALDAWARRVLALVGEGV